jgi:hypothetical protein
LRRHVASLFLALSLGDEGVLEGLEHGCQGSPIARPNLFGHK